jgi:hypothetical protein
MVQQGLVSPCEHLRIGVGLDRGTEAVGAVLPGNPSPFPPHREGFYAQIETAYSVGMIWPALYNRR